MATKAINVPTSDNAGYWPTAYVLTGRWADHDRTTKFRPLALFTRHGDEAYVNADTGEICWKDAGHFTDLTEYDPRPTPKAGKPMNRSSSRINYETQQVKHMTSDLDATFEALFEALRYAQGGIAADPETLLEEVKACSIALTDLLSKALSIFELSIETSGLLKTTINTTGPRGCTDTPDLATIGLPIDCPCGTKVFIPWDLPVGESITCTECGATQTAEN